MAFYPNYQPYQYQDQLNQLRNSPLQGQFVPPMQQRPDASGLNWVQGEAGAKSWIVTPGATVLLMDSEGMKFYLKTADANGVPSLRTFEYAEVSPQKTQKPAEGANYVTVESFDAFKNDVLGRLETLSAESKKGVVNEQSSV